MPELIRSIVNRLRDFVGNRRRAPRHSVRLEVELALMVPSPGSTSRSAGPGLRVSGYTRDISATGLAVIVPTIRAGGKYITGSNQTLQITLALPSGPLEIYGTPVRYSPLEDPGGDRGYLVGVQIERMSVTHRTTFSAYVETLRK
ncbi:MAG: PilZ domain [Acidobacteriota bacterium]|nr:PilZ domain [Acidobacteriota bacterium]